MDATPDTLNYMIGGYVVFAIVMVGYIISLVSRWNSLKRDQDNLKKLE